MARSIHSDIQMITLSADVGSLAVYDHRLMGSVPPRFYLVDAKVDIEADPDSAGATLGIGTLDAATPELFSAMNFDSADIQDTLVNPSQNVTAGAWQQGKLFTAETPIYAINDAAGGSATHQLAGTLTVRLYGFFDFEAI